MALVTLRVLEGLERGLVFEGLATPVSIGREEDNDIQLNDDRISRFHAKLQDDGGAVILTDLESTNGTRVNGHPVQMHVLQPGDLLSIGRCLLLYGDLPGLRSSSDRSQATDAELDQPTRWERPSAGGDSAGAEGGDDDDFELPATIDVAEPVLLFPQGVPPLPVDLRPLHRAQLSDFLAHLHEQLGTVLEASAETGEPTRPMVCPREVWNRLLVMQATLSASLRKIADPG